MQREKAVKRYRKKKDASFSNRALSHKFKLELQTSFTMAAARLKDRVLRVPLFIQFTYFISPTLSLSFSHSIPPSLSLSPLSFVDYFNYNIMHVKCVLRSRPQDIMNLWIIEHPDSPRDPCATPQFPDCLLRLRAAVLWIYTRRTFYNPKYPRVLKHLNPLPPALESSKLSLRILSFLHFFTSGHAHAFIPLFLFLESCRTFYERHNSSQSMPVAFRRRFSKGKLTTMTTTISSLFRYGATSRAFTCATTHLLNCASYAKSRFVV